MKDIEVEYGNTIAYKAPPPATLDQLITALNSNPGKDIGMLKSTAAKLEEFFKKPGTEISIDAIEGQRDDFAHYLETSPYKRSSVRTYCNYLRILVTKAKSLGWKATRSVPVEWQRLQPEATLINCGTIFRHFAQSQTHPGDVTEEALDVWLAKRVNQGYTWPTAYQHTNRLRRILFKAGYGEHLDASRIAGLHYGIPIKEFTEPLRFEVEALLKWKQAEFAPGRPKGGKLRVATAKGLSKTFGELVGFVVRTGKASMPEHLMDLLTEQTVQDFVVWSLEHRHITTGSLRHKLALALSAVRHHPKYKDTNFGWFDGLVASLPKTSDIDIQERKDKKFLPREAIAAIPAKIRAGRSNAAKFGDKQLAVQVRNEVIIAWFITMAWRQSNMRMCRVGGNKPNLFQADIQKHPSVALPLWAQAISSLDAEAKFWQFKFTANETKNGRPVHCILPQSLTALLDDYLLNHRGKLLCGSDPGTLFVNMKGKPFTTSQLHSIVCEMTLRHGGRTVTPHLFRDSLATYWLKKKPEDYLTVSKLLWHRNINITIGVYGNRFNESAALARMEDLQD